MTESAAVERPAGNPRRQVAEIMAQALGGSESTENPEQKPQLEDGENPEQPLSGEGSEAGSEGEIPVAEGGEGESDDEIRTLTDLAAAIEVEPEFLYRLALPMSDGEDPIPLGEIKDRLQEARRTESQRVRFEQERAAFQQERDQWAQNVNAMQAQVLQTPQEIKEAEAQLTALGQAWQYLEENKGNFEAGELALKKQEIQTAMGTAQTRLQQAQGMIQAQQREQHARMMQAHAVKILEENPDWRDQAKALEGRAQIGGVLSEYGFQQTEVDGLYDHRLIRMLRDFAKLKTEVSQAKKVLAKGPRAPRVLKAGASLDRTALSKKALKDKLEAAKNSNDRRVKAAAVGELLSGGF